MSIQEKQLIQYGNGITIDINQIPFDRFSEFLDASTSLRPTSWQESNSMANWPDVVDCHTCLVGRQVARAPRNDVEDDIVFKQITQNITSSTKIVAKENFTLSFEKNIDNLIHHIVITIPTGSSIVITDELYTKEFYGSIIDVIVEEGATVQYQINKKESANIVCRLFRAFVKRDAKITWLEKVENTNFYKSSFHTYLQEENATGCTYGVFLQNSNTQTDIYSATYHLAPSTKSDAVSKGVLQDNAKAVHRSLIHIFKDAPDSEGYERQDTLLLSDSAQINAIPNLEIENNQVKCSHGATTTNIDDEKLFYFLSRGLDKQTAQDMFVSGHVGSILEKFIEIKK